MARITAEDCLKKVTNRFDLVLLASKRARQLLNGSATPLLPIDGDKMPVVALREIAAGVVDKQTIDQVETNSAKEDFSNIAAKIINESQVIAAQRHGVFGVSDKIDSEDNAEEDEIDPTEELVPETFGNVADDLAEEE